VVPQILTRRLRILLEVEPEPGTDQMLPQIAVVLSVNLRVRIIEVAILNKCTEFRGSSSNQEPARLGPRGFLHR
jgi:hypothetical protein